MPPTCCALKQDGSRCLQYARREELTCTAHRNKEAVFHDLEAWRALQARRQTFSYKLNQLVSLECTIM